MLEFNNLKKLIVFEKTIYESLVRRRLSLFFYYIT